jgi:PAS domain S-box-containing protein
MRALEHIDRYLVPPIGPANAWIATLGASFAIALAYFGTAELGLALLAKPSGVALFWPASGIAVGLLVAAGRRAAVAVVVGVVVGTVAANLMSDRQLLTSVLKGFCNAGEAVLVSWLLDRWFGLAFSFGDVRRVLGFFAATAIATAVSAVGGALTMTTFHASAPLIDVWRTWFLSDAVGIVVVAPLLIALRQLTRELPTRAQLIEWGGVLALTVLITGYALSAPTGSWLSFDPDAIVFPLLLWLAIRNQLCAIAGALAVSLLTIVATTFGIGHFGDANLSIEERALGAQLLTTVVTAFTLVLTALFAERRASEQDLRESEERLRLAQLKTGVGIWDRNARTGKLIWTPQLEAIYGLRPGSVRCYADFRDRVHPDDVARIEAQQDQAVRRREATFVLEFRIIRPDGKVRWISAVVGGVYDEATGEPVRLLGNNTDITERKLSEQALAERNAQLALAGKAARVGSYAYDVAWEVMQISEGYAAIHGFPEGTTEIARCDCLASLHPEDVARAVLARDEAFRNRQSEYSVEYRIYRPDGEVRWVETRCFISYDSGGRPHRVVGVCIDNTERKLSEQALAERNAQFDLARKAARVGTFTFDNASQTMQLSDASAIILGLPHSSTEISADDWHARVHPDDVTWVDAYRRRTFRERRPECVSEFRIIRPGGEVRWIEARATISYDDAGRAYRMTGVYIDTTERRQAEDHKTLLIAELDHRVKNTLACVAAVTHRTRDTAQSMDDFVAVLEGRINSLANAHSLLSLNRWHGVSIAELVRGELAPCTNGGDTQIDGPEIVLTAEATQPVTMVLHELVTNAAKYGALSNGQGRISVCWRKHANGRSSELVLDWRETGGPPIDARNQPGYGTTVIRNLIPYELGGIVHYELAADGARCRMQIPAKWLNSSQTNV